MSYWKKYEMAHCVVCGGLTDTNNIADEFLHAPACAECYDEFENADAFLAAYPKATESK